MAAVRKLSVNEWTVTTSERETRAALEAHLGDIPVVRYERWEKGDVDCHGKGENMTQHRLQLLNKSLPWDKFIVSLGHRSLHMDNTVLHLQPTLSPLTHRGRLHLDDPSGSES